MVGLKSGRQDRGAGDGDGTTIEGDLTRGLLRGEGERNHQVSLIVLFFDLVYVFAITQLSHLRVEHLDLRGAAQTASALSGVPAAGH